MTTALVTGATAGIGWSFAKALAADGYDVVLVARDEARLHERAGELRGMHGVEAEVLVADLSDRAQLQRVADRLASDDDPVDLLVNNAGFGLKTTFTGGELADEERMFDVLCRAVLVTCHAAARAMRARGHGAVVNVSSMAGFLSSGTYSAAKSWVSVFTEGLATELAGTGVTATAVCPGFVRTEFHARARMAMRGLPDRAWLDSDEMVREALADVRRGRVVSVPSRRYKVAWALARVAPRPLVRRASVGVGRARRR
jgi:hypothetical protein